MQKSNNTIAIIVLSATVVGIGFCLYRITQSPTANEALLLSLFMTLLSILASWIVSRHYARISYEDNLKVFARKAAEKVTNTSNELDRLSKFLQKALDEDDFANPAEELLAKSIRFEDAIHLITSLKSVNDTSLSDWKGIIGDELLAQREAQMEEEADREERLRVIVQHLETMEHESVSGANLLEQQERERLRVELSGLRAEVRTLFSQVGGFPLRSYPKRKTVEKPCPNCAHLIPVTYGKAKTTKKVGCPNCNAKLYSHWDGAEVQLNSVEPILESLNCPKCNFIENIEGNPLYGATTAYDCAQCKATLRAVRTKEGMSVRMREDATAHTIDRAPEAETGFSDERLEEIAKLMGPQPWPFGKSHEVRVALGIKRQSLDYAIKALISKGVFKPQIDGVLYEPPNPKTPIS